MDTEEIEDQIERQPKLGMALIQMLVERCLDFEERLQSMALDKTPQRVALSMLSFAERLGTRGRMARSEFHLSRISCSPNILAPPARSSRFR